MVRRGFSRVDCHSCCCASAAAAVAVSALLAWWGGSKNNKQVQVGAARVASKKCISDPETRRNSPERDRRKKGHKRTEEQENRKGKEKASARLRFPNSEAPRHSEDSEIGKSENGLYGVHITRTRDREPGLRVTLGVLRSGLHRTVPALPVQYHEPPAMSNALSTGVLVCSCCRIFKRHKSPARCATTEMADSNLGKMGF